MEKQVNFECEFRMRRHDGEYRWLKADGVPWKNGDGDLLGYIGSTVDITDRREDELRMLQAQKLESMGVLAGGIAHDFNNLLTGILGASNLLAETEDMPESASPLLNGIATACARAADLTRQILAYAGKGRFVIEPVNVSELAHEMSELLRASVPKNVTIIESLTHEPAFVIGDKGQIQQVIMNLVLNATESLEGKPGNVWKTTEVRHFDEVELATGIVPAEGPAGDYLVFMVRDEGIGMDEKILARIFDPFYTTKTRGRGLGLSAVLGIVRGHNGGLSVKTKPGKGTTFSVVLPLQQPEKEQVPVKETTQSHKPIEQGIILVVDDETIVRSVVENAMRREGYFVVSAEDGLSGVEKFVEHAGELVGVFLDLTMPKMNGDEALTKMRQIRADVPVVVMSGYSENEVSERFGDDDRIAFLQKPFTIANLKTKFESLSPR
jgi:signal transduction histidine kinase/CheY-like chemotaxis protein